MGRRAAAGLWRTRRLVRLPARRPGGGLCVCTLPDSPPRPPLRGLLGPVGDRGSAVWAGRVSVLVGLGAAAGLWCTRPLLWLPARRWSGGLGARAARILVCPTYGNYIEGPYVWYT